MIKFPINIFNLNKIESNKTVNRRSIRFLLKSQYLQKGKQIETVLQKHIISCDDIVKCPFCGWLRRFNSVKIHQEDDHILFTDIEFFNKDSHICFESVNPSCPKTNYNRKSEEYLKIACPETYKEKIQNMKNVAYGRYTLEWFIDKYGSIQGPIEKEKHSQKLSKMSTEEGFIEKYGEVEGKERWKNFIDLQSKKKDEQFYINKHGKVKGKELYKKQCERWKKMNTLEDLTKRHGEEKAKEIIDNKRPNLSKFIDKYGEIDGPVKYKEYCESKVTTLENMIQRHGEIEGTKLFNEFRQKSARTEENFINQYGEVEGKKKYKDYLKKLDGKCSEQWYIDRYGTEEGKRRFEKFRHKVAPTLQTFINKYGETKGREKHKQFVKNVKSRGYSSKIATDLFKKLEHLIDNEFIYFHGNINGEKRLDLIDRYYHLDFYDEKNKKCIEFYGDYFHANPSKYEENHYIELTKQYAKDIWQKDNERLSQIKSKDINVKVIWESEYKSKPDSIIKECLQFLDFAYAS